MELGLLVATWLERGILAMLFVLSVWSVAIMIDRRRTLRRESIESDLSDLRKALVRRDAKAIKDWQQAHPGVHAEVVQVALDKAATSKTTEKIDRAVRALLTEERLRLEKGLPVLATLGANTPFIGLFGTVLGIIRAFAALGDNSGAATSVMSGISQALVATAAGLFVAIPAVVAFNAFSTRLRMLISQCESLKDLLIANMTEEKVG